MAISRTEAKKRLVDQGITVQQWADENGYSVFNVRAVLSGHNKGNYGVSHDIAVALGLKDGVNG